MCQGDSGQPQKDDPVAGQVLGTHGQEVSGIGAWRECQ